MIVESASWQELSLVSEGAFSGAIIERVSASTPDEVAEGYPRNRIDKCYTIRTRHNKGQRHDRQN